MTTKHLSTLLSLAKKNPGRIRAFHYACGSLDETPIPIHCIAVQEFDTGEVHTFSKNAGSENALLGSFRRYVLESADRIWVGWNCLTPIFGPKPITERYKELVDSKGGFEMKPLFDMDQVLVNRYGEGYAPGPKLWGIARINGLQTKDFVSGPDELNLAESIEWWKLERSAIRKVKIIGRTLQLAAERRLKVLGDGAADLVDEEFWGRQHPTVTSIARPRFTDGHRADAVEAIFKNINVIVKRIYHASTAKENDGADLMFKAFGGENPVLQLSSLKTQSERDLQEGYRHMFAGAMKAIRNPLAHGNEDVPLEEANLIVSLGSLLMRRLEDAGALGSATG